MAPTEHTPKPTYKVGEYALCFHHELLYEAKILDTELNEDEEKDAGYLYRVHYKGWKNTWDDWVPEERLRKDNEENRQLQKDIAQQQKRPKATKKANADGSNRASEDRHSSAPIAGRGTKRGRDYDIEKVGNRISSGQHEYACGPRPRGIWEPEKIDVVKQPISWKSAGGDSFLSSKDWFTAEKVEMGPILDFGKSSSGKRPLKENSEIWNLLSKTKAAPKPEAYSVTKYDWKRGINVKMGLKGIRLEPLEIPNETLSVKRGKEGKPSIMSPVSSPITTMAPLTSMAQLISMTQPSIERGATSTVALAGIINGKVVTEPSTSGHQGAERSVSTSPTSTNISVLQRSKSSRSDTQERLQESKKRDVVTKRPRTTANGRNNGTDLATTTRATRKRVASTTAEHTDTKRLRKSRFLPTGATVNTDGTAIHVPAWILEREANSMGATSKLKPDAAKRAYERSVRQQDLKVNTLVSIEQSTPEGVHKVTPLSTSSASSLTTPPASPKLPRSALTGSLDSAMAAAASEDSSSILAVFPALRSVSPAPTVEHAHPAPIVQVGGAPQISARSIPQASLLTPRTSPGPATEANSSSPSTLDTATLPTSSATSTTLASPEILQTSAPTSTTPIPTSSAIFTESASLELPESSTPAFTTTHAAGSLDVISPVAPAVFRRSARDKKPTKRAREFQHLLASDEETFIHRPTIRIPVPDTVKALLVDDWENVTKNLTLAPLPHPHPVSELLRSYLAEEQSKRKSSSVEYDRVEEVTAGVKEYFDKSLGVMLLYKFERQQYKEILAKTIDSGDVQWEGKTISDVYGPEHLCRLFVSFPELIAQTNMDQQSVSALREELAKLMSWLAKNAEDWFALDKYKSPSKEYTEKARAL